MDHARAGRAVTQLADLPITRHSHLPLIERIWTLRERFTAYDGIYVALAELLDVELVTADARLARAARDFVAVADL